MTTDFEVPDWDSNKLADDKKCSKIVKNLEKSAKANLGFKYISKRKLNRNNVSRKKFKVLKAKKKTTSNSTDETKLDNDKTGSDSKPKLQNDKTGSDTKPKLQNEIKIVLEKKRKLNNKRNKYKDIHDKQASKRSKKIQINTNLIGKKKADTLVDLNDRNDELKSIPKKRKKSIIAVDDQDCKNLPEKKTKRKRKALETDNESLVKTSAEISITNVNKKKKNITSISSIDLSPVINLKSKKKIKNINEIENDSNKKSRNINDDVINKINNKKKDVKKNKKTEEDSDSEFEVIDADESEDALDDEELGKDVVNFMKQLNFKAFSIVETKDKKSSKTKEVKKKATKDEKLSAKNSMSESLNKEVLPKSPKKKMMKKTNKVTVSEFVEDSEKSEELSSPTKRKFDPKILGEIIKNNQIEKVENKPKSSAEILKERMTNQMNAARFRVLNETLYSSTGSQAQKMFVEDNEAFHVYHQGYQSQVAKWPLDPISLIVSWLDQKPKDWIVADFGCGEARLASSIRQTTHSLDLVAVNEKVIACDMANTPLQSKTMNVVVFCLSLMGTNINDFIVEANRVLMPGGIMKIVEVESRFSDVNQFVSIINKCGFRSCQTNQENDYFWSFEFKKIMDTKNKSVPRLTLKPCIYKRR